MFRITVRNILVVCALAVGAVMMPPVASGNQPPPAELREIPVDLPAVSAASTGGWRVSDAIPAGDAVLIGAEWTPDATVRVQLRASRDGSWDQWHDLVMSAGEGPEPGSVEEAQANWAASEPVWVGRVDRLQVRLTGGRRTTQLKIHTVDIGGDDSLAFDPESAPGEARAATRPNFIMRSSWDPNNECRPRTSPSYASDVRFAVVHHTAGSNNYSSSQSANIVRSVCLYHRNTLGWNDIGYNMVVDRFGRSFEGRAGGLDRAVIGAHAAGHNTGSTGISVLGCFQSDQCSGDTNIPWAAVDAVDRALAWKFTVHDVNPHGTTRSNSRTIPNIVGHRDVGSTACPGNRFYTYVRGSQPMADRVAGHMTAVANALVTPVTGDWNGDGVTNIGWFYHGGRWTLRMTNGATRSLTYGRFDGDVPVTGDWNGDGRDRPGIFRGGEWHLRNALSGPTDYIFTYGIRRGDVPVPGDWNGTGRDGPGIFRGGEWHLRNRRTGPTDHIFTYGLHPGDDPVVGDWNRNGRDGPGIHRKASYGEWHLRNGFKGKTNRIFTYGRTTDLPITGDWNRNGTTTPGAVRGGTWFFNNSFDSSSDSSLTFPK